MLIVRLPVFPSHAQVNIGDYASDPDTWPEWDDEEFEQGVSVSSSMLFVGTADRSDRIIVDVRDGKPTADEVVLFDGILVVNTLSVTPGGSQPVQTLVMPGGGAWDTVITANARDRENIRHLTVYFPEFVDLDLPDGPWMQI